MSQSFCISCGKSLHDGAKFCGSCGAKVAPEKNSVVPSNEPKAHPEAAQTTTSVEQDVKSKPDVRTLLLSVVSAIVGFGAVLVITNPVNLYLLVFAVCFPILSFVLRPVFDRLLAPIHRAKEKMKKEVRVIFALIVPAVLAFVSTFFLSNAPEFAMGLAVTVGLPLAHMLLRRPGNLQQGRGVKS